MAANFSVENHFSIYLARPLTHTARDWVAEHISADAQCFGDGVVVEHRFIADVVRGAFADGLVIR